MLFLVVPVEQIAESGNGSSNLGVAVAHALYKRSNELFATKNWTHIHPHGMHRPRFIWLSDGQDAVTKALMLDRTIHCVPPNRVATLLGDELSFTPAQLQQTELNDNRLQQIETEIQHSTLRHLQQVSAQLHKAVG